MYLYVSIFYFNLDVCNSWLEYQNEISETYGFTAIHHVNTGNFGIF